MNDIALIKFTINILEERIRTLKLQLKELGKIAPDALDSIDNTKNELIATDDDFEENFTNTFFIIGQLFLLS